MENEQKFWELIKSGDKTVELRKVSKLKSLDFVNGRFEFAFLNEKSKILGSITCNGYWIIPNIFNRADFQKMYELSKIDFHVKSRFKNEICNLGDDSDEKWIYENWEWLTEYFKDEKEILVLNIENFNEFKKNE